MLEGKGLLQAMGYHINKKGSIKENKLSVASVIDLLVVFDNFYQDEEHIVEYISKRKYFQLFYILLERGQVSKDRVLVIFN